MLSLPAAATGSICGPTPIDARIPQCLEDSKYWRKAAGLPLVCMDGRPALQTPSSHGVCGIALPGATVTIAVAAAHVLAEAGRDVDLRQLCELAVEVSHAHGFPAGGHRAQAALESSTVSSGCAAADLVPTLALTSQHLAGVITELGLACGLPTLETGLHSLQVTYDGRELIDAIDDGGAPVANLTGGHKEVAIVVNHRTGWVLDRPAMMTELGADWQVFSIDAWAYAEAAAVSEAVVSRCWEEAPLAVVGEAAGPLRTSAQAAAGSFTFAALLALCAPTMPVLQVFGREDGGVEVK